jgi:ABC-type uncharacterized transport system permease subunit
MIEFSLAGKRLPGNVLMVFLLNDRQWFLAAVFMYGLGALYSIFLWRGGFRRANHIIYAVLLAGFGLHTWSMVQRGASFSRCPINNLYEATAFIVWTMCAVYMVVGLWPRLRFLGAFLSPLLFGIGIFAMMPALDTNPIATQPAHEMRSLHAALTLLACGGFGLSAASSLMFLTQAYNLKFNKLRAVASLLPSIERLERVTGIAMITAFILLTLGMASGSLWLKSSQGAYVKHDPIILWTVLIWLFYLALLLLHLKFGIRGRRFAHSAVGAFLFLMLTFWGFFLLSPVHHP